MADGDSRRVKYPPIRFSQRRWMQVLTDAFMAILAVSMMWRGIASFGGGAFHAERVGGAFMGLAFVVQVVNNLHWRGDVPRWFGPVAYLGLGGAVVCFGVMILEWIGR